MEGSLLHRIKTSLADTLHRIKSYFFVYYMDHFSHLPHGGEVWESAYGYAEEVGNIIATLAKAKHTNVVLVGQEGVGSLGIAREVARRVHASKAAVDLRDHRVLFINIEELFASNSSGMAQLQAIATLLAEMERSGKSIAVLTNMGGVFAGNYSLSAEDVLYPFFASQNVRTIAIASDEEFETHIASHKDLSRLAHRVQVQSLGSAHVKELLKSSYPESLYDVIDEVVDKTEHISPHISHQKRAATILEELIAEKTLHPHHVTHHISKKIGIDTERLREAHLLNIENALHRSIVNQTEAKKNISHAFVRARSKPQYAKYSIASLFFTGPSGVGKTETAKALANIYFGSSNRLITIDMAVYAGELPSLIAQYPYHVFVFRHFEESTPEAQIQILSALKNGYITDGFGRKYYTTHMIMIAMSTSENTDGYNQELVEQFDGIVSFTALSQKHVREIVRRMLARLNGRLQIEYGVSLEITDELLKYLVQTGYSEEFGVHGMAKQIQETVENAAMQVITEGKVVPGGKIVIDPSRY